MAKKLLSITIHGKWHKWSFEFMGDPKYLEEWRADGLYIDEVVNTIPEWLPVWISAKWWAFLQDLFGFRNPWGGK